MHAALPVPSSLHLLPAAVCAGVRLPGRPPQPQSHAEYWDPALVGGRPLQLLHLPPVFLALLPVPGGRGHRLRQLLHHRAHRPGRPLCEGPADPGAGRLLHLYPRWKWSGLRAGVSGAAADWELALGLPNPPRGAAEKQEEAAMGDPRSSWCEDVRYLGRNWSFVWSTLGVTAIAFVTGALGFWAPKFLFEARVVHGLQPPCLQDPCNSQDSLIFGILTVVTGIIGVVLGAEAARRYKKVNPRAEPLICAYSLLAAGPCLFLALILARVTLLASYVFLALGELLLSCNWAVVADILLSVVVPRCRGTAEALQITVGHVLGDAGSPYLTGLISGTLRAARPDSYLQSFLSLQHSFLGCAFIIALGGGCFLLTALRLEMDQAQARQPGTGTPDSKDTESQALLSGTGSVAKDL
ncbi:protein spinster homolog 3 isoform X7 [Meles meles]|uniref:protein spinster homolog 3 isoform X7 n=1 Tax=Meles meles TaxID=9662 RepID=UPI001E69B5C1|nr:protein spinster homolog 3 isoform X7 [Meles meles]